MKSAASNALKALAIICAGIALGAAGVYIGETDDAPGAAFIGLVLMLGGIVLGVKVARRNARSGQ